MSEQIIKIGNHELVHITEVRELRRQLAEANEYARKLNLKITDLCKERDSVKAALARKQDAGDLLFEELDDKTPEPNCECSEFCPCYDCDIHGRSRAAIMAWKEANKQTVETDEPAMPVCYHCLKYECDCSDMDVNVEGGAK